MNIGKLDRRIEIKTKTKTGNHASTNAPEYTWAVVTIWAQVNESPKGENYEAEKNTAINTVEFTIRHRSTLDNNNRIGYDSKEYRIERIETVGRKEYQKVTATLHE